MDARSAIGLSLALCSVILTNIALLIQKHSSHVEAGRPLYKRWRFILGFLLNTGSEIGLSAPASLFAPLSLLAPLGGVAVVVNALLTRFGCVCGIKERLSFLEWLATFFVMCGVALVAFSGPGGDTQVVLDDLPAQFSQPAFLAFLIPALIVVCLALWLFPPCNCLLMALAKRVRPASGTPARSALSGFTAATCGAFSVLALKISLFTIVQFFGGHIAYPPPISILCFVVLVTCAPLQLYLLNLSLAAGKATFSIPLYLSLLMLFISFFGGILFNEFGSLMRAPYPLYLCLYIAGCLMVLLGLAVLSYKQQVREGGATVMPVDKPDESVELATTEVPKDARMTAQCSSVSDASSAGGTPDSSPFVKTSFVVAHQRSAHDAHLMKTTNGYLCDGSASATSATPWTGTNVGGASILARLSLRPLLSESPNPSPMPHTRSQAVPGSIHGAFSISADRTRVPISLRPMPHPPAQQQSDAETRRPSLVAVQLSPVGSNSPALSQCFTTAR